jgi:hypothetical protein
LDDAGVFHTQDGATLFAPGSFCTTYTPASYVTRVADAPTCDGSDDVTDSLGIVYSPTCRAWAVNNALCGSFVDCYATCDGVCHVPNRPSWPDYNPPNRCEVGAAGDAYCNALFAQFILPSSGKTPLYACIADGSLGGVCGPTTFTECNFEVVVFPDGGAVFDPTDTIDASGAIRGAVPGVTDRSADGGTNICEPVCTP